jgi:C2 domain
MMRKGKTKKKAEKAVRAYEPVGLTAASSGDDGYNPGKEVTMSAGTLLIQVMGARHLAGKDKERLSDPYCIVSVGSQKFKTAVVKRNLAPRWAETFRYEMKEACPDLYVSVWDASTKQFMGETTMTLEGHRDVPFRLAKEHWFALKGGAKSEFTTDVKKLAKQRKEQAKRRKRGDFSDLVSGEIGLRVGLKTDKADDGGVTASLLGSAAEPVRFEDYESVELDEIVAEAETLVNASQESTERTKRLAMQTRELGITTLGALKDQGEQLLGVQSDIVQINMDLKEGERELRSISSIGGQMRNAMASSKSHTNYSHLNRKKDAPVEANAIDSIRYVLDDPNNPCGEREGPEDSVYSTRQMLRDGHFDMLSGDTQQQMSRIEDNLDIVSDAVDDMQVIAVHIGAELAEHNRRLDEVNPAVARTNERTRKDIGKVRRQW